MREKFGFFGPACLIYGIFYAFCMFKNGSGITFPIFMAVSLIFYSMILSQLDRSMKKGSLFYTVSIMLLAVSTFCTDDGYLIFFNKTGIFLLVMSLLLHQFADTSGWKPAKYFSSILQLTFCSIGEMDKPFRDGAAYYKEKNGIINKKVGYALLGVVIAVPLLLIVLLLLSSADAVFRNITDVIWQKIRVGDAVGDIFHIVFRIVVIFLASYALIAYLCSDRIKEETEDKRKGEPILAITIAAMLSAVYVLFCGIQIVYLFFGNMALPEGYTYAGYAREGFFQLLAVSILNLGIVLIMLGYFRESKVLKGILTVMSFCTFIMIASSALRMIMYIRYYYLTYLRVLVLWALLVLFVLFIGVVISIYKDSFRLFRYGMFTVTVLYLALSFAHPDYIIAKVNVANAPRDTMESWNPQPGDFFQSGEPYHDYEYLASLSADAAPVIVPYMAQLGYHIEAFYEEDVWEYAQTMGLDDRISRSSGFGYHYLDDMKGKAEDFSLRTYNISRHMMLRCVKQYR